jgi:hypothetical protein
MLKMGTTVETILVIIEKLNSFAAELKLLESEYNNDTNLQEGMVAIHRAIDAAIHYHDKTTVQKIAEKKSQ